MSHPVRIQRKRTKGWRMPEGAVYVGRPSRWGNDLRPDMLDLHDRPLGVTRAVELYRLATERYLDEGPDAELWIGPLIGMDLACWCPEPCGEAVPLYGVAYGDQYEPCAKPRGHDGGHDPSVAPWCHADVLLELANASDGR